MAPRPPRPPRAAAAARTAAASACARTRALMPRPASPAARARARSARRDRRARAPKQLAQPGEAVADRLRVDVQLARGLARRCPGGAARRAACLEARRARAGVSVGERRQPRGRELADERRVGVQRRARRAARAATISRVAGQHAGARAQLDAARRARPARARPRPRAAPARARAAAVERARRGARRAPGRVGVGDEHADEVVDARADRALADDRGEALGVAMIGGDRRQAPRQRPAGGGRRRLRLGASGSPAISSRTSAWRSRARSPALAACALA